MLDLVFLKDLDKELTGRFGFLLDIGPIEIGGFLDTGRLLLINQLLQQK